METFFFYLLSVWGLTHILVASKIIEPTRNWLLINSPFFGDMLNCYQCTSFWTSMILYFFFNDLHINAVSTTVYGYRVGVDFLLWSFIGSGLVSFLALIMSILINKSKG
jgi:hypothetical protein